MPKYRYNIDQPINEKQKQKAKTNKKVVELEKI
jgi:hypothetical protein